MANPTPFTEREAFFVQKALVQDYNSFIRTIKEKVVFVNVLDGEEKILYEDDEGTFVSLKEDRDSVTEMLCCAKHVKDTGFKRLKIVYMTVNTPIKSPVTKQPRLAANFNLPVNRSRNTIRPRPTSTNVYKRLEFPAIATHNQQTAPPLQRYLKKKETELSSAEEAVQNKVAEIRNFQEEHVFRSNDNIDQMPLCSRCHTKTARGHNRLNCPNEMCTSSKLCGKTEKNPDEKSYLNLFKKEEREVRKEMNKLEKEIIVKRQTAESLRSRFVHKVRDMLIQSNPEKYLSRSSAEQRVENDLLINRDARILEKKCGGKRPANVFEVQNIMEKANNDEEPQRTGFQMTAAQRP